MTQSLIYQFLNERTSSWPILGIILLILALLIRHLLLHDLLRDIRKRNPVWFRAVQDKYQKSALAGWGFLLLGISGFLILWIFESFLTRFASYAFWVVFFIFIISVSYLYHMRAYARSIFDALQDERLKERDF